MWPEDDADVTKLERVMRTGLDAQLAGVVAKPRRRALLDAYRRPPIPIQILRDKQV